MTADTERDALVARLREVTLTSFPAEIGGICDAAADQIRRDGERIAELEAALHAQIQFADAIADAADIDMDETRLVIRVMPDSREVGSKSWAEVQADGRAALAKAGRA